MKEQLVVGRPVRDMQTALRYIAHHNDNIPLIIPDGIFGMQTEECVREFQAEYGLPVTGVVDLETWDRIFFVLEEISESERDPLRIKVYPDGRNFISPGEDTAHVLAIQALISVLAQVFPELGNVVVSGVHDENSVAAVKNLQRKFGLDDDGIIDKRLWNSFVRLYESFVSGKNASNVI